MRRNAEQYADKTAIDFENQSISWNELWRKVEADSGFFIEELGVKEQKVVALLLTNSIEFVSAYLAVLHAGHMVLPLDPAYKKLELDAIIGRITPALVITSPRYKDQLDRRAAKTIMVSDIQSRSTKKRPLRLTPEKQVASLTFTSGTSGTPKTVPNTHANHIWNIKVCSKVWRWTTKDSLLICLPLSHMHGLVIGLSGAIYHGNTLYLKQQAFKPDEVFDKLSSGKISMFTHAPLAYSKMLEFAGPRAYDLSKVRVCISGGAPLAPSVWQAFKDRFKVEIVETYGSSETGRIAGNRLDKKIVGSPGPPMPEVDLKLSGEGEVLIKSPGVFPGYFDNPEATAASRTADGYWRTGDIAELKNGNIFLKGRIQERIRRFSYTISPRDVEWALRQNPGVKDIFVLGRQIAGQPNDKLIYFVVSDLSEAELRDYCKTNLLFAWRPDQIVFLEELPKTRSGKTRLNELESLLEVRHG